MKTVPLPKLFVVFIVALLLIGRPASGQSPVEATPAPQNDAPDTGGVPPPPGFTSGDVSPSENTDVSTMITTGCGYDAWTGAVRRAVTDIDVPGAVSSHGLKVVRTYTSSTGIGWSLSWQWQLYGRPFTSGASYLVNFPDGRAITFKPPSQSLINAGETAYRGLAGTKERLFLNNPGSSNRSADLYLEDGSHVHFTWDILDNEDGTLTDLFYPESFSDPYGQVTALINEVYDFDHPDAKHLTHVIDPSGRELNYNYDPVYPGRLANITASTGQSVAYTGYLDGLPRADYSDGTNAVYTYVGTTYKNAQAGCPQNICHSSKLETAQDVRAEGVMQSIRYTYVAQANFQGQVHEEQHLSGLEVSRFNPTNGRGSDSATNTENRGDGPQRSFYMEKTGNVPLLKTRSDFRGVPETYDYDSNNYLQTLTDRNNNATGFQNEAILGRPQVVTHPSGSFAGGHGAFGQSTRVYTYTDAINPYYLYSVKDDNQNTTVYQRDQTSHRITEIDYPDNATETFQYNEFGEVTRHKRKNGYYEFADYDDSGLLVVLWNPVPTNAHPSSGPKTTFTYYPGGDPWQDRVKDVIDPFGNTTTYQYDLAFDANGNQTTTACSGRGTVTKITYPAVAADNGVRSTKTFVYDKYGNKKSETDEVGLTTQWTYDAFNRIATIQLPGFTVNTTYDYTLDRSDPPNAPNGLAHTDNSWTSETTPGGIAGIQTLRSYDVNMRMATETKGASDSSVAATTRYGYDNNGNRTTITDPRGASLGDPTYTTSIGYDTRNRKISESDPAAHLTTWEYDSNGNITEIDYPDGGVDQKTSYDPMNRVLTERKLKDAPSQWTSTNFTYYPAGTLQTVTDGNGHTTTFDYDKRFDLQSKMTYDDGSYQTWAYDDNKNLGTHVTGDALGRKPDGENAGLRIRRTEPQNFDGLERGRLGKWSNV